MHPPSLLGLLADLVFLFSIIIGARIFFCSQNHQTTTMSLQQQVVCHDSSIILPSMHACVALRQNVITTNTYVVSNLKALLSLFSLVCLSLQTKHAHTNQPPTTSSSSHHQIFFVFGPILLLLVPSKSHPNSDQPSSCVCCCCAKTQTGTTHAVKKQPALTTINKTTRPHYYKYYCCCNSYCCTAAKKPLCCAWPCIMGWYAPQRTIDTHTNKKKKTCVKAGSFLVSHFWYYLTTSRALSIVVKKCTYFNSIQVTPEKKKHEHQTT